MNWDKYFMSLAYFVALRSKDESTKCGVWKGINMTNRYHSLTVVLEKDIREDDAEYLLNAIKMIKGVLSVDPFISDIESHMAESRARQELGQKLWEVLYPKEK